jgi:predicted nucleic acid-binding protein
MTKSVFVDSGGFFAAMVAEDAFHKRGLALFEQADRDDWRLFTTNAVVIEAYTLLLTRSHQGRAAALTFLDLLEGDGIRVERIRKADEVRAFRLVRSHTDKTYSLCDALSFVVMERLGLEEAIAFDRHFREYGRFVIL